MAATANVQTALAIVIVVFSGQVLAAASDKEVHPSLQQISGLTDNQVLPPESDKWQVGLDYYLYPRRSQGALPRDKVTVVFRVTYISIVWQDFESYLQSWKKKQPAYVSVIRKPSMRTLYSRNSARIQLTLQELGREDFSEELFSWMLSPAHNVIYHSDRIEDQGKVIALNLAFAAKHGIDVERFAELYNSAEMDARLQAEELNMQQFNAATIVVNNRYGTEFERLLPPEGIDTKEKRAALYYRALELVDFLVAAEAKRQNLR